MNAKKRREEFFFRRTQRQRKCNLFARSDKAARAILTSLEAIRASLKCRHTQSFKKNEKTSSCV